MKRFILLAVGLVVLATACGGKYRHPVGNCYERNGKYRVEVRVMRDKGVSETEGLRILHAACAVALK